MAARSTTALAGIIILAAATAGCSEAAIGAQTPPAVFDSARAWVHLRSQVAFGPRPAGSEALARTRQYILDQLAAARIDAREQRFTATTPAGAIAMSNVIATIPGRRSERIVLASHFDTKRAAFRFVGANDSASSTAALLELGRALRARQNELTIELLFLDGEEAVNWDWAGQDNTYGSRHYVQAGQKAGTLAGIKALVLLDMIGEQDLMVRRETQSTPWLVDIIWATARRRGHAATFSNESTEVADDHVPFLQAGVPSADIIDLEYAEWHTAADDLDRVSARSLQIVGDVVLASLPAIEQRVTAPVR